MVNGVHVLFPLAKVGHIGMCRNEETLEPDTYYCKLPHGIENKLVIVIDPMLATGGSACDAISLLKEKGCTNIKLMSIIGAPEGVSRVAEAHPDVKIYVSKSGNTVVTGVKLAVCHGCVYAVEKVNSVVTFRYKNIVHRYILGKEKPMRPVTGLTYRVSAKLNSLAVVKAYSVRTAVVLLTDSIEAVHTVDNRISLSDYFDVFSIYRSY